MTGKTNNGTTSNEVASIEPTLLSDPYSPVRVKSVTAPASTNPLVFPYPLNSLSAELTANINKKWEACWPINMLRPLVLLDLISYLLFIKKLEERQLIPARWDETSKNNLIPTKEKDELSWSRFKDMDSQSMHKLFTEEKGVTDLIKNYGHSSYTYSLFLKEPLLLTPTASLLANMMDIIKIMEAENTDTGAAIFEFLLNKAEITSQNGQVYAPDYVAKLIVTLMQPTPKDAIGDPSAGNGSFLVSCVRYIANKYSDTIPNFKNNIIANIYKGIESDLIQLRIGAMNMILHGIEDPKLECLNVFKTNLSLREQPNLILSNLFFEGSEDKMTVKATTLQTETKRPEFRFLKLILKSLKTGGRVAVLTREIILYDNITEIKTIRQQIIDEHKLEGVISLPGKPDSLFSGASILIFTKPETDITTDKVWFYKMDGKEGVNKKRTDSIHAGKNDVLTLKEEQDLVMDILSRWKNEKEETDKKRTDKSFYVPVDEIRNNNYNLGFNEYRTTATETMPHPGNVAHIIEKESVPAYTVQKQADPIVKKIQINAPVAPVRRRRSTIFISIAVICIVALASYFLYFKNNNENAVSAATTDGVSQAKINKPEQPVHKPATNTPVTGMLSQAQIKAILKDTSGIIHYKDESDNLTANTKDPGKGLSKFSKANTLVDKNPGKTIEPVAPANALKVKYTVVDTTFFHDQPDESTSRKSYLDPLNKNVLNPIDDQNGFIYIVYTNRFGRTSKGWINKKDLRPIR